MSLLKQQYQRAKSLGWLLYFQESARLTGERIEVLIAIGSRESNLDPKWLRQPGDNGNGFGLLQIDKRSFPEWVATGKWRDARESIQRGALVLYDKRRHIQNRAGTRCQVRDSKSGQWYQFTMPVLSGEQLERAAIAAYNAGDWSLYHFTKGRGFDYGTTGRNYSDDVLKRAAYFKKLLDEDISSPVVLVSSRPPSPEVASPAAAGSTEAGEGRADVQPVQPDVQPAQPVPVPAGIGGALKAFGKLLVGGYRRVVLWIAGLGVALDAGIFASYPALILLLLIAVAVGFAVYYFKKRKSSK